MVLAQFYHGRIDFRPDAGNPRLSHFRRFARWIVGAAMINWNIAGNPINWFKIGLMAAIFVFGFELVYQSMFPKPIATNIND